MGKETLNQHLSEPEIHARAQRMAVVLCGIARNMSRDERDWYKIPDVIDPRAMRNALAARNDLNPFQEEHIKTAHGIWRYFSDNLPKKIGETK
jgi:hypothetical protein